jgi:hypothetical protein
MLCLIRASAQAGVRAQRHVNARIGMRNRLAGKPHESTTYVEEEGHG